ncbi:putative tetratricopeptide-like helical domain-containing protein [Lupinus albus]|uniref:Putative tetratricopeptide-like helical domain-containing protein n=1 Tax=Lupinus albus TaxID=3870 RepID=A0A6A4R1M6_LUPAL|nr:putative tetratricopeptide-like helical domain-containing protein [Lupinus albus]
MEFRNLCFTLRFFSTIPHSFSFSTFLFSNNTPFCTFSSKAFIFSSGCSNFYSPKHPFLLSSTIHNNIRYFCTYPYSHYRSRPYATPNQVSNIIALIREDVNDLVHRLNMMDVSLSMASVVELFHVLSSERVSALRFFDWLKFSHPEICSHSEIVCLVVNNCGLLGNYEAMAPILNEFNLKGMHLGRKAFDFLLVLCLDKDSSLECLRKMLDVLIVVGGVCQSSGVQLLIEMFSVSGRYDIAQFVIGRAGRKVSYYNMLMRTMCKRGDYERAGDLVKEMKRSCCEPNISTYNLLVSCLCKNGKFGEACQILETMEKDHGVPDASTFNVVINLLCKDGQFDLVLKLLDKMTLKGVEPLISTHASVIKSYFESGKYDEAHRYVVDSADKRSYSSNANYSLLASLHLQAGNVLFSQKILYEMMDKGLKPNFPVYMKIKKCLQKINEKDLSSELLRRYSRLIGK